MAGKLLDNPAKYLKRKYKNNEKKIIICNPGIFSDICEWEQRKALLNDNNIFLLHYKINADQSPKKIDETEEKLQEIFYNYLRNSDVITRHKKGHYIQLLVSCNYMGLNSVIKRVKSKFKDWDLADVIDLICDYEEINGKGKIN